MSYGARRRLAALLGALAAVGLTALGAWALGGHAPNPETQGSAAARPRTRTVTRSITVRSVVRAAATSAPTPAATVRVTRPRTEVVTRRAARAPATQRAATTPTRRPAARKRPAGAPAAAAEQTAAGGYRAFASATAASAGDLVVARSGSGVALDGHELDTTDELGALAELPGGRTAFGRALAMRGDAAATSSSPPAGAPAGQDEGRGSTAATTARTDAHGACVLGGPISSAEAQAAAASAGPLALTGGRSRTESLLDGNGERHGLLSRAIVVPPEVSVAPGTPGEVVVRFLGPVELLVRAGGTPGSASVGLGPQDDDMAAPLVEIRAAGRTVRYTAADVLDGGGRTLRAGPATLVIGGAPRAWRGKPDGPSLVDRDGRFASAAADLLTLRLGDAPSVALGHLEASVAVPARGVAC